MSHMNNLSTLIKRYVYSFKSGALLLFERLDLCLHLHRYTELWYMRLQE